MVVISVGLILASQMIGNTMIILCSLGFYLFTILTAPTGYLVPMMLFYLPWSTIIKLSPSSISFVSVATLLVFIRMLFMQKNALVNKKIFLSIFGLFLIAFLSKVFHGYGFSTSYIMFFVMLFAFSMIYDRYSDETSFEIAVIFFALGIILATLASIICAGNSNIYKYIVVMDDQYLGVTRYCGFYSDPNFYAAQVIPAVGALLVIVTNKKEERLFSIILIIALIMCGITSLSKSFLICLTLIFAIWLLSLVVTKPSMFLLALLLIVTSLFWVLSTGMFSDVIDQYLIRFGGVTDSSSLTTGRSDLWKEYIDFLWDNPLEAILGQGFTSVFNGVRKGSHNTIIQLIYQFGLIGMCFLFSWLLSFRSSHHEKPKFFMIVLLFVSCFSMWMGLDILFFDDFFLIIMLFSVGINHYTRDHLDHL